MKYHKLQEIEGRYNLDMSSNLKAVEEKYPILVSDYYFNLIDQKNIPFDPIWKQCIPNGKELEDTTSSEDPFQEEQQMPAPRLIHRYQDRALLLTTNQCHTYCRFCFRKRYWKNDVKQNNISDEELDQVCDYLSTNQNIREILVSGGDPLTLSTKRLKHILDKLTAIQNIDVIRIATRAPVVQPSRIDKKLVDMLSQQSGLWFVAHFNHPNEVTPQSIDACTLITKSGIPILNQTVLLKDINDNASILADLFRKLIKIKLKPHYLFHVDPVRGVKHFTTGIDCGLNILNQFRNTLSSIATPHFCIDIPNGIGKISLQPNYSPQINADKHR